jgi:hypothetical protein
MKHIGSKRSGKSTPHPIGYRSLLFLFSTGNPNSYPKPFLYNYQAVMATKEAENQEVV